MSRKIVCLDPGHGGHDSGAVGPTGLKEKDAVLEVCLEARKLLLPFVDVIMTRSTDEFISLSDRPAKSNAAGADVFVSYHFNSASSPTVPLSWEIFTTRGQNRSDSLANIIGNMHQMAFPDQKARMDKSDGDLDKEAGFTVIVGTDCPSCLMEGEFIHTMHGEASIRDKAKQKKRARVIAKGVLEFLGVKNNIMLSLPAEEPEENEDNSIDLLNIVVESNNAIIKNLEDTIDLLKAQNNSIKNSQ